MVIQKKVIICWETYAGKKNILVQKIFASKEVWSTKTNNRDIADMDKCCLDMVISSSHSRNMLVKIAIL